MRLSPRSFAGRSKRHQRSVQLPAEPCEHICSVASNHLPGINAPEGLFCCPCRPKNVTRKITSFHCVTKDISELDASWFGSTGSGENASTLLHTYRLEGLRVSLEPCQPLGQTRVGFLCGGREKSFHQLLAQEQASQKEGLQWLSERNRFASSWVQAATVIGCLKYSPSFSGLYNQDDSVFLGSIIATTPVDGLLVMRALGSDITSSCSNNHNGLRLDSSTLFTALSGRLLFKFFVYFGVYSCHFKTDTCALCVI